MSLKVEGATVTLQEPGVLHDDLVDSLAIPASIRSDSPWNRVVAYIRKVLNIAEWEVRKLRHDPTDIFTRAVQPALWLLVFGETFARLRAINTGGENYLDFLAPGILAQSVLFLSIFYGIAIIWERDLGITHKFLASP